MQKFTFNGADKLFIAKTGVTQVNVETDLYSDWKEEVQLGNNLKFKQAFRTIGGDPLGGSLEAGAYFFLQNDGTGGTIGWRVRADEADHDLEISGNLFGEDANLPLFVPTLGNFTVTIRLNTSSLTQLANQQAIQDKTDTLPAGLDKGVAFDFPFVLLRTEDHVTPLAGLSPIAQLSKDNGVFTASTNSVLAVGSGGYHLQLAAAEMNADTVLLLVTAGTFVDPLSVTLTTES